MSLIQLKNPILSLTEAQKSQLSEIEDFINHPERFLIPPTGIPSVEEFIIGVNEGRISKDNPAHRFYYSSREKISDVAKCIEERRSALHLPRSIFKPSKPFDLEGAKSSIPSLTSGQNLLAQYLYFHLCNLVTEKVESTLFNKTEDKATPFREGPLFCEILEILGNADHLFFKSQFTSFKASKSTEEKSSDVLKSFVHLVNARLSNAHKKGSGYSALSLGYRTEIPKKMLQIHKNASEMGVSEAYYAIYLIYTKMNNHNSWLEALKNLYTLLIEYKDASLLPEILQLENFFLPPEWSPLETRVQQINIMQRLAQTLHIKGFHEKVATLCLDMILLPQYNQTLSQEQINLYANKAQLHALEERNRFGLTLTSHYLFSTLYDLAKQKELLIKELRLYMLQIFKSKYKTDDIKTPFAIKNRIKRLAKRDANYEIYNSIFEELHFNNKYQVLNKEPTHLIASIIHNNKNKPELFDVLYDEILTPKERQKLIYDIIKIGLSSMREMLSKVENCNIPNLEDIKVSTQRSIDQFSTLSMHALSQISDVERKNIVVNLSLLIHELQEEAKPQIQAIEEQQNKLEFIEGLIPTKKKKPAAAKSKKDQASKGKKQQAKPNANKPSPAPQLVTKQPEPVTPIQAAEAPKIVPVIPILAPSVPTAKKIFQKAADPKLLEKIRRMELQKERIDRVMQELQTLDLNTKNYISVQAKQERKSIEALEELFNPKANFNSILSYKLMKHIVTKLEGEVENLGGADGFKLTVGSQVYTTHNSSDLGKKGHGGAVAGFKDFLIRIYQSNQG